MYAKKLLYLQSQKMQKGRLAEWLGGGLQNLIQRFKSATDLNEKKSLQVKSL